MRDAVIIGTMGHGTGRVRRRTRRGVLLGALLLLAGLLLLPGTAGAAGTVKCTPNNAPVGTPINVAMAGLPAGQTVTVTTSLANGSAALTRRDVTVAGDGTLSIDLNTTADSSGDYTVQALDKAGMMLAQGRYTLTAAPQRLPSTGGGYAANDAAAQGILLATVTLGALALFGAVARRRARGL